MQNVVFVKCLTH